MWNAPELTPTTANDEINTSLAYGFGFDFCGVEIDRDTGVVRVDHYVSAHDCGTILNPGLAEGQIKGSWASAWGATFLEEFCYDDDGTFRSGSFAEYLVPTAAELPDFQLVHPTPPPFALHAPRRQGYCRGKPVHNAGLHRQCRRRRARHRRCPAAAEAPRRCLQWIDATEPPPSQGTATATTPPTGKTSAIDGSGQVDVPASPQTVWDLLLDPEQMARLIPGCERLEKLGDDRIRRHRDARGWPGQRAVRRGHAIDRPCRAAPRHFERHG